jgi:PAS domain S-box-containing protein
MTSRSTTEATAHGDPSLLAAVARVQALYIRDAQPSELFNTVLDTLLETTGSEYGFIGEVLHDEAGRPYLKTYAISDISWNEETHATYEAARGTGMEFRNLNTLFGAALVSCEPVISNAPGSDPRAGGRPAGHPPLRAFLGAPVLADGRMVGLVGLANRVGGYDEALLDMLNPLLLACGSIIERFRYEQARGQAEMTLAESRSRYKAIFETVVDGIITIDERGRIDAFNPAAERIFGYTAGEVIGRNVSLLMPEPDRSAHDGYLANYLRTGRAGVIGIGREVTGRRKDGSTFPMELAVAEKNIGGQRRFNGIVRDISARKAVERRLQETLALQSAILSSASYGIISTDAEGVIRAFNAAAEGILGYRAGEVVGQQVPTLFHDPDELAADAAAVSAELGRPVAPGAETFAQHIATGAYEREWTYIRKDGSRVPVRLSVSALRDESGSPAGFLGIVSDVSEQRRAREQLQRFSSEMQAIFTLSPDGFVVQDEGGRVTYSNPAFLALTGLAIDTLQGASEDELDRRLAALCEPEHALAPMAAMPDGASDALHLARPRAAILKRSVRRIQGEGGRPLGRVLYFRDISSEMELQRMKSEFLATAAHELRTPLASILGFSELLMSQDYDAETRRDLVETIHRQSSNMVGLVSELLDLARIEVRAGKDFNIRAQALLPIIDATVRHLMVPGDPRKVTLRLASSLPPVMVDADKLEQALLNLLANAYKYSPDGGVIELATLTRHGAGGPQIGIAVTDHGIGMASDVAARVGERFYRADNAGGIPGTGLGLSLVKEILEFHHGELQIESRPGAGATVTLWLPAVQASATLA